MVLIQTVDVSTEGRASRPALHSPVGSVLRLLDPQESSCGEVVHGEFHGLERVTSKIMKPWWYADRLSSAHRYDLDGRVADAALALQSVHQPLQGLERRLLAANPDQPGSWHAPTVGASGSGHMAGPWNRPAWRSTKVLTLSGTEANR